MATAERTAAPGTYEGYEELFASIEAPFAFVDLDAMWANAQDMVERAAGKPIRVATKSLRCRPLIQAALAHDPGFRGLMTFTLAESLWLAGHGFDDLLVAYSTAEQAALAEQQAELSANRLAQVGSGERAEKIRTYNYPQGRITDHRINLTLYKIDAITEGDMDELINALAAEHQAELLANLGEEA